MLKTPILFFFIFLAACGGDNMDSKNQTAKFQIGEPVQHAISASSVNLEKDCMFAVCTYKHSLSFVEKQRISIEINPSKSTTLSFEDGVGITLGTFGSDIINDAEITLGGVPSNSPHTLAMSYFYRQLDMLSANGWHRFILHNEARIAGTEAAKFDDPTTLFDKPISTGPYYDPDLRLTLQQWLAMPMFSRWYFYKDGIYLKFRVQREDDGKAPADSGSYLFTLTVLSEEEFYKMKFRGEKQRSEWKTLLPEVLHNAANQRAQTEARLKSMGVLIDESYQDPAIKSLR